MSKSKVVLKQVQQKLSDKQFKSCMEYRDKMGVICCPLCKSVEVISYSQVDQGNGCANIFECDTCKTMWDDVYEKVTSIIITFREKT